MILYPDTQVVVETWRHEFNGERPNNGRGGPPAAAYGRRLTAAMKTAKVTAGLERDPLLKAVGRHTQLHCNGE